MRIFLLPLTTRQALIYCQRAPAKPNVTPSIPDRVTKKVTETWAQWEAAKGGWRKTLVTYGNQGLKRIPYQEWGLKSFPPSNPKLQAEQIADNKKFDVVYPGNVMHKDDVPKVMARLAKERKQLHWNRFIGSMVAMPFTIPFVLVPVIPNIPFFYAAYRSLKGSDHLDFILDHRLYRPVSPPEIEELYEQVAPDAPDFNYVTASQVTDGSAPPEKMILPADSHDLVAKTTGVVELSGEVERAVWQVQRHFEREKKKQAQQQPAQQSTQEATNSEKAGKSD
ncbi:hypothetical protein LTR10_013198 [Elasticomyces elasticus]|uniref:Mitochondrial K+-H+ exchange-related-domain-containing protein n=1 Tax=Exophiala sideris TaxID=1016849 RepID=A0ABR0JB06_9EURO|nr:hypothetical protein LTR10_013198 [Elasticomyces elasticus]KAK5030573.1 hypothetical protein LTS07_005357 [Exophiala sideris]KAK5038627.1 hypothetical protein LTR13_004374 [Exophiala sideris]KAK5060508.1 hypothetical protein LTR69_005825 [Exophiala sideris]KAK5183420.1 hypothetical protein LTR44_004421 [Eurotiomycetes sp. CCFEE 6388]